MKVSLHILDYKMVYIFRREVTLIRYFKKKLHNCGREMNFPLDGVWDKWEKSGFVEVICLKKTF